jgi:hypothetical protein
VIRLRFRGGFSYREIAGITGLTIGNVGLLKELLAKATGKLEEVLKVEQQIQQVRGQIEQLQAKKRLWDNQVAFSTLIVDYRIAEIYHAEAPVVQTFGQRASQALSDSWETFTDALASLAIGALFVLPWLPVALVLLAGGWLLARRMMR